MNRHLGHQEVYTTAKTKRGVPVWRTPAAGSDKAPRVKGDTFDPKSQYFKGERA